MKCITNYIVPDDKSSMLFDFYLISYIYSMFFNKNRKACFFYNYDNISLNLSYTTDEILSKVLLYFKDSVYLYDEHFEDNIIDNKYYREIVKARSILKNIYPYSNPIDIITSIDTVLHYSHYNGSIFNCTEWFNVNKNNTGKEQFIDTVLCEFFYDINHKNYLENIWLDVFLEYKSKIKSPFELYKFSSIKKYADQMLKYIGHECADQRTIENTYIDTIPDWVETMDTLYNNKRYIILQDIIKRDTNRLQVMYCEYLLRNI